MRDIAILVFHLLATVLKLIRPGGTRSVVAESLLLKHQLLILNRSRQRAPNLKFIDRVIAGMCAGLIRPARLFRSAIVLKPSTLMSFHRSLVRRKYQWLFSPKRRQKPGPKGPSAELVAAIIEMKRRNPNFGCRRIAEQVSFAFGVEIDKDVVRRILAKHFRRNPSGGASWLTFLGHSKDSLWGLDLFRCESLFLRSLGHGYYGPVQSPNYRIRRPCRDTRWAQRLPHARSSHFRNREIASRADHRSRSSFRISSMESQFLRAWR